MITDPDKAVDAIVALLEPAPVPPPPRDPRYSSHQFPACTCSADISSILAAEEAATRAAMKQEAERHEEDCGWAEAVLWLVETWDIKDVELGRGR